MIYVYGYTKCSTVKKTLKYLENNNVEFKHIDNVLNKLSVDELKAIHELSNLEIKKLFNTSGIKYRELNLKDKVNEMSLQEAYELLAMDGMLVKRPLIVSTSYVIIGHKEDQINKTILGV